MKIPIKKQQGFIQEFEAIRPVYIEFAHLLEKILNKAVSSLSILAIVQARPKSIVSFTNKIISKDKYQNPLVDMTDLCGARVIVHFQSQVEKICNFIKENFEIDEANSLDLKSKLKVNEFGYRSVHYIITPKKDSILDEPIDDKFKSLKAEVQVRTLAEHVWADISHDRIYKTDLIIPDEWKREAARLSAMLENADNAFAGMSAEIDSLATVYELQYEAKKAAVDIDKLKTLISVLAKEPDECVKNSLKLSAIYRAKDDFDEALKLLNPLLQKQLKNPFLQQKLRFEYGVVLALSSCNSPHKPAYTEGLKILEQTLKAIESLDAAIKNENEEELSYIYYRYGKLLQRNEEEIKRVADCFTQAHNLMPQNPLYLVSLMDALVLRNQDMAKYNVSLFRVNIHQAIPAIKQLIGIGIKQVPAWFALGHCCLFLDDETGCINAYANAVDKLLNSSFLTSQTTVLAEIALVGKLKAYNRGLSEKVKLYLNIALASQSSNEDHERFMAHVGKFRLRKEPFKTPVVIVAGGASKMDEGKTVEYSGFIRQLMHDFKGTIISGGTTAGIPGLVGAIKTEIQESAEVGFDLLAYLPIKLPANAVKEPGYDLFYESEAQGFSALDILVCWSDLISNGTNPKDVILIGIDGGEIAGMEYRIALSLGAKVGLINYSGRAVSDFVQDKNWKNHPKLLQLPEDPLTVWALVNQEAETSLTHEEIEVLARQVHEFYRQQKLKSFKPTEDINKLKVVMPWEYLDPVLKASNLKQVAFYEHILKRVGLSIRRAENPLQIVIKETVTPEEYMLMAKLEHARWNAERLLDGWKYGAVKDISAKINPCITAWEKLDEETQGYDYEPIDNIPLLLALIGLEVYKA